MSAARAIAGRGGRGRASLLGLLAGAAATMAPGSALAAAVWLIPAVLASIAERAPGRPVTRCLLLAGAAGALPGLAALWRDGGGVDEAAAIALDPARVAMAWAAQAFALLLTQVLPVLTLAALEAAAARRIRTLTGARQRLEEEYRPAGS